MRLALYDWCVLTYPPPAPSLVRARKTPSCNTEGWLLTSFSIPLDVPERYRTLTPSKPNHEAFLDPSGPEHVRPRRRYISPFIRRIWSHHPRRFVYPDLRDYSPAVWIVILCVDCQLNAHVNVSLEDAWFLPLPHPGPSIYFPETGIFTNQTVWSNWILSKISTLSRRS